jgi:type IV pilus assembly protein PilY1
MWELSATQAAHSASVYAAHIGYTTPKPSLVLLNNGKWAAVISNGYESASGTAMLFLIDLSNGELIRAIDTEVGSSDLPNGLSSPIAVDTNNDRTADAVYAGDLQGNLWKFDLSSTNSDNWTVAYEDGNTPKPLFTTCETNEVPCTKHQTITAKPEVGYHPAGGYMVYFGTGKYVDVSDNVMSASPDIHTLYGIRDNGVAITNLTSLVEQTILQESIVPDTGNDLRARITSNHAVDFTTQNGWYMRLIAPNNTKQGERIIARTLLRNDRLIITTLIPPQNSCTWGGSSWITEINALDGTPLDFPPIDINDDLQFTDADKVDYQGNLQVISAIKKISLGMVLSTPEIITHTVLSEGKYLNGTLGTIGMFRESTSRAIGRQSWRRLR